MSDTGQRVVIAPEQFLAGSPMPRSDGAVRDLKLIYPETRFDAITLCLGLVEPVAAPTFSTQ